MSLIYRGNEDLSKDDLKEYLIILESSFGDTINKQKPRNYFAFTGKGYFEVDMSNMNLNVGCSLTFILNFRIRVSDKAQENKADSNCNLISISFSDGYSIDFDLDYPMFFVVKEIISLLLSDSQERLPNTAYHQANDRVSFLPLPKPR